MARVFGSASTISSHSRGSASGLKRLNGYLGGARPGSPQIYDRWSAADISAVTKANTGSYGRSASNATGSIADSSKDSANSVDFSRRSPQTLDNSELGKRYMMIKDDSCEWWTPDPGTGMWAPKGRELEPYFFITSSDNQVWFRAEET